MVKNETLMRQTPLTLQVGLYYHYRLPSINGKNSQCNQTAERKGCCLMRYSSLVASLLK